MCQTDNENFASSKYRPIKTSPYQNIALFNYDFMAGHTYQTANHLKSGGSVYKGSIYAGSTYLGSVYGGSMYAGSAQCPAQCSTQCFVRCSTLKTLHMEALYIEALRIKVPHNTLYNILHNALYNTLY